MAKESGFDPLFSALEACLPGQVQSFCVPNETSTCVKSSFFKQLLLKIRPSRQQLADSPFVQSRHEIMATKVLSHAERYKEALILLSAGENQFGINFTNASDSILRRTVVCLHQPPSWLRRNWRDFSSLNGLGAIICLSHEQMEFIAGICTSPTILIRHGVCHDFFMPAESPLACTSPRLIFVGQWLRDFDTLVAAMDIIWYEQPETTLDCVVAWGARNHPAIVRLAHDKRVYLHSDIPSELLRDLYQKSSLLFLPLIDSVANNAIVEAMASGLPIVSTRVGGIADYVPQNAGELCPHGDAYAHAKAVLYWLANRECQQEAGFNARQFAESELDWGRIASNLVSDLRHIAN